MILDWTALLRLPVFKDVMEKQNGMSPEEFQLHVKLIRTQTSSSERVCSKTFSKNS